MTNLRYTFIALLLVLPLHQCNARSRSSSRGPELRLQPPHDSRGRHGHPGDFLPPNNHRGPGHPPSTLQFPPPGPRGPSRHHSGPGLHGPSHHLPGPGHNGPPPHHPGHGPHGPPPHLPGPGPHDPFGPHRGPHMPPPHHSRDRSPSVSLDLGSKHLGGRVTLRL